MDLEKCFQDLFVKLFKSLAPGRAAGGNGLGLGLKQKRLLQVMKEPFQTVDKVLANKAGILYFWQMLRKQSGKQLKMEFVCLEDLVPKDHLLRKIDKYIEFDFIYEKVSDLYCPDNGRPALDPVVMFKMLFIGYLFNIRSEKQLIREIKVNIAYRWFLGMGLEDPVPDASTFSQNRRRRFKSSQIYREIFDEIVTRPLERRWSAAKFYIPTPPI